MFQSSEMQTNLSFRESYAAIHTQAAKKRHNRIDGDCNAEGVKYNISLINIHNSEGEKHAWKHSKLFVDAKAKLMVLNAFFHQYQPISSPL